MFHSRILFTDRFLNNVYQSIRTIKNTIRNPRNAFWSKATRSKEFLRPLILRG